MSKRNRNRAEVSAEVVTTLPVGDNNVSLYGNVNDVIRIHLGRIEEYCRFMAPGVAVTEVDGAHWQMVLYRALMGIVENDDGQEMMSGCDEILKLFRRERKGALQADYVNRFIDVAKFDRRERDLFTRLCLIFSTFCTYEGIQTHGKYYNLDTNCEPFTFIRTEVRERFAYYLNNLINQ